MTMTAVADHIDNNILAESHAEIKCQLSDEKNRLRIISIDVKNRCVDHLGHIGGIQCRARIRHVTGGETDLVVDDDVHSALGRKTAGICHVEGFHHDTLTCKGCVAMDGNGDDQLAVLVVITVLA